jgi:hypothetical protein
MIQTYPPVKLEFLMIKVLCYDDGNYGALALITISLHHHS